MPGQVWVESRVSVGAASDLLVCPAFPLVVSGLPRVRRWTGSGGDRWAGAEDAVPQRVPRVGPGPVRGQVQHPAALRAGDPGGHGDDLAAQGRAAGHGMLRAGQGAGGAEQVVGDRRADRPGAVRGEPARGQVGQGSVDQVGEDGLDDRVPTVGDVGLARSARGCWSGTGGDARPGTTPRAWPGHGPGARSAGR